MFLKARKKKKIRCVPTSVDIDINKNIEFLNLQKRPSSFQRPPPPTPPVKKIWLSRWCFCGSVGTRWPSYRMQNICPPEEFSQMMEVLRTDLPSSFRITGSRQHPPPPPPYPPEKFSQMMEVLRTDLPSSFRITGSRQHPRRVRKIMDPDPNFFKFGSATLFVSFCGKQLLHYQFFLIQ